jgi:hypothetical protein
MGGEKNTVQVHHRAAFAFSCADTGKFDTSAVKVPQLWTFGQTAHVQIKRTQGKPFIDGPLVD